jgi:hypothetical protein
VKTPSSAVAHCPDTFVFATVARAAFHEDFRPGIYVNEHWAADDAGGRLGKYSGPKSLLFRKNAVPAFDRRRVRASSAQPSKFHVKYRSIDFDQSISRLRISVVGWCSDQGPISRCS